MVKDLNPVKIKTKKLYPNAIMPLMGSKYAAGHDLYALVGADFDALCIDPGKTVMVHTGISVEIPEGFFGAVFARSGLATKEGLRPANCVGVVDCDYRGEVMVALHNDSSETRTIQHGDRIAQLVILPYLNVEYEEVTELSETDRGEGGFGSTGKE